MATPIALSAAILAFGALGVALFAADGSALFVAMTEAGMAWCF